MQVHHTRETASATQSTSPSSALQTTSNKSKNKSYTLTPEQRDSLAKLASEGYYPVRYLAALFGISRENIYIITRCRGLDVPPQRPVSHRFKSQQIS